NETNSRISRENGKTAAAFRLRASLGGVKRRRSYSTWIADVRQQRSPALHRPPEDRPRIVHRRRYARSLHLRASRTGVARSADPEDPIPLDPYSREDLLRLAHELVVDHSVVVISDYAKGVLTEGVALEIIRAAREAGAYVIVDPKSGDHIRYRGADLVKPN